MRGEPGSLGLVGLARLSRFKQRRRWRMTLAAAATIVAAVPLGAAATAPPQQEHLTPPQKPRHLPPPVKPRPPPSQAEITRVVDANRPSIKACYERALPRDSRVPHDKITVKLSIGISGRVKNVHIDGLVQFRSLLEPCIREAASHWIFPQASEEYGTEFPFVFVNDHSDEEKRSGGATR